MVLIHPKLPKIRIIWIMALQNLNLVIHNLAVKKRHLLIHEWIFSYNFFLYFWIFETKLWIASINHFVYGPHFRVFRRNSKSILKKNKNERQHIWMSKPSEDPRYHANINIKRCCVNMIHSNVKTETLDRIFYSVRFSFTKTR